jgi:hypothetical protein
VKFMAASRYRMTFRVWHPAIDPKDITLVFGMEPRRSWKAGEPRTTPTGTQLGRNNRETYWYAELCQGDIPPDALASEVNAALDNFAQHREFLERVRAEGGRCEFFIGWYIRSQAGETFPFSTLAKMADLGIDLALDNYYDPDLPDDEE